MRELRKPFLFVLHTFEQKKRMKYISIVLLVLVSAACRKENAAEVNPDFIGTWNGQDEKWNYNLQIESNGLGDWRKTTLFSEVYATGKTKVWKNKLKVGVKKFELSSGPQLIYDAWGEEHYEMVMDGVTYSRY